MPFIIKLLILVIFAIPLAIAVYYLVVMRRRAALVQAAPMLTAAELTPGLAKMEGKIAALHDLLTSPIRGQKCVYFTMEIQRRKIIEYRDSKGNLTRTEDQWDTVVSDVQAVPCTLKDRTGHAEVNFKEAEITLTNTKDREFKGDFSNLSKSVRERLKMEYVGRFQDKVTWDSQTRYTERVLRPDEKVCVVGTVALKKAGKPHFVKTPKTPLLVTDQSEEEMLRHFQRAARWLWIGLLAAGVVFFGVLSGLILVGSD